MSIQNLSSIQNGLSIQNPSRRSLLVGATSALAVLAAVPQLAEAAATVSTYTDNDILNFALNLEYLEANFYYLAAFGTTIDAPNAASTSAGAPTITLSGPGTAGLVTVKPNPQVPFASVAIGAFASETAIEEGKHVRLLRNALGSAAVTQPALDLQTSFNTLATAAGLASPFDPLASDANFLLGAFVFEDVGVTAYRGAAPLISNTLTGRTNLQTASGLLAVEGYHAGLVRTALQTLDPAGTLGLIATTQKIAALRAQLSAAVNSKATVPDDYGLSLSRSVTLEGGSTASAAQIADTDPVNSLIFNRNTTQILNIVTGGNAASSGSPAKGLFFPAGLNGLFV